MTDNDDFNYYLTDVCLNYRKKTLDGYELNIDDLPRNEQLRFLTEIIKLDDFDIEGLSEESSQSLMTAKLLIDAILGKNIAAFIRHLSEELFNYYKKRMQQHIDSFMERIESDENDDNNYYSNSVNF